ncbi:MAG: sugar ABC transporter permease [Oscillospiraceae bacterium]
MKPKRLNPGGSYWIWYVLPALVFYVLFMAYPMLDSVRMSFYTGRYNDMTFTGFDNFAKLFSGGETSLRYWSAFKNTCVFFIIHMLVQNVLGILFAVLLTQPKMRGFKIYQTIIFIPCTFAVLVTGYLWKLILNPQWSGLGIPLLGNESTALICVALVSCWQWIGIPTMMFVAALNNISEDIYEAADIEGATPWQVFLHIKLPLIKPVVGIITILTFVNNFNAFDVVFAMENANGAPGYSTDLIGTLFYRVGIAGQHPVAIPDTGLGAAIATITFILLLIGSLIGLKLTSSRE